MKFLRWIFLGRDLAAQIDAIEAQHYKNLADLAALAAERNPA